MESHNTSMTNNSNHKALEHTHRSLIINKANHRVKNAGLGKVTYIRIVGNIRLKRGEAQFIAKTLGQN